MLASDILGWAAIVGAASAARAPALPQCTSDSTCAVVRQETNNRCGARGQLDPAKGNFLSTGCTASDKLSCAQQCLDDRGCKSFAFNPRRQSCVILGKTLKAQGFVNNATSPTRFFSRSCFDYQCDTEPVDGPNLITNPSFAEGNDGWTYENDHAGTDDNAQCYANSEPGNDDDYAELFCGSNGNSPVTYTVTQPVYNLDIDQQYGLVFALGYASNGVDDEAATAAGNTPGFNVYVGGELLGGGSVCTDGVDAGNDAACSTTPGDTALHWRTVGPYPVSIFGESQEIKFEFTSQYWDVYLDTVDFHQVGNFLDGGL